MWARSDVVVCLGLASSALALPFGSSSAPSATRSSLPAALLANARPQTASSWTNATVALPSLARFSSMAAAATRAASAGLSVSTTSAPSASPSSALNGQAVLASVYGWAPNPPYQLNETCTDIVGTGDSYFTNTTWAARGMTAWTRFYIDSFYDPSSSSSFLIQLLNQSEINWQGLYCDISLDQSSCSIQGAYAKLQAAQQPQDNNGQSYTNHEVNALLLFYSVGNWMAAMHTLWQGAQQSSWDQGVTLNNFVGDLLPTIDPVSSSDDFSIVLDVVGALMAIIPEVGLAELIIGGAAEAAAKTAEDLASEATQSALDQLTADLARTATGTSTFAKAAAAAARANYGDVLSQIKVDLGQSLANAGNMVEDVAHTFSQVGDFNEAMSKASNLISDLILDAPTKLDASQPSQVEAAVDSQLYLFQTNMALLYNATISASPYAAGGLFDLILDGQFANPITGGSVVQEEEQLDTLMEAFTFSTIMGGQGKKVVIYKQAFQSPDLCSQGRDVLNQWGTSGVAGAVCVPYAEWLTTVANDNDPSLTYLFAPLAMQMNQYNTMWLTPPNTEGSGGFANIGDYPMPSIASQTVPGWEGSSFNMTRLFWNAWHAQYGVAGYNGYAGATANASLWTSTPTTVAALPAADPAPPPQYSQPAAPYVFPVLDRTSADQQNYCNNWPYWRTFNSAPFVCNGAAMWFVKQIDIAVMMGWGTAEGYAANYSVD